MNDLSNKNIWDPEISWRKSILTADKKACIGLLQISGWDLLSKFLNGGIGKAGIFFPAHMGTSRVLQDMSASLVAKWREFSNIFAITNPLEKTGLCARTEEILCLHYQSITPLVKTLSDRQISRLAFQKSRTENEGRIICKMVRAMENLQPLLHSYWFHGSIGSSDVKLDWSDFDGLAIISSSAFSSPKNLRRLRHGLIKSRAYMTDFMPYQMHGHFVLAEADLASYPSGMFPAVLFNYARCVFSTTEEMFFSERSDKRMALEILWKHGVYDLSKIRGKRKWDTLEKIAFLHRTYLLPCLVSQVYNKPVFKESAFENLEKLFSSEDAKTMTDACSVWANWEPPPWHIKAILRLAWPFRFNPLIYQAVSHKIGKKLPWLCKSAKIDWTELSDRVAQVAERAWHKAINAKEPK